MLDEVLQEPAQISPLHHHYQETFR